MSFGAAEIREEIARQKTERTNGATAPTAPSGGVVVGSGAMLARVRAYRDRVCEEIASTPRGARNDTLSRIAFNLGGLAHYGISTEVMLEELMGATRRGGWDRNYPHEATARRQLAEGAKRPRELEDREYVAPARPARVEELDEGETAEDAWKLVGSAQLWAPLEPPAYVVGGVVTRGSLVEIVGYGAGAKTWIAIDLAVSVATGAPWLGLFPTEQGRVAYLDWENGNYELRRRLQGVTIARDLGEPTTLNASFFPSTYMTSEGFEAKLAELAAAHDLVIVDTLKAASPGVDENDSAIRAGLDVLRRVGEATGCTFVVLLHSKKVSGSLAKIDAREAGRGSSAIFDAADVVLHATYDQDASPPFQVHQTKARNGRPVEPFGVELVDINGGVLVEGRSLPNEDETASRAFENACEAVLEVLRANPQASRNLLASKAHKRPMLVSACLEELERTGAAQNVGTAKKPSWVATGPGGVAHAS